MKMVIRAESPSANCMSIDPPLKQFEPIVIQRW